MWCDYNCKANPIRIFLLLLTPERPKIYSFCKQVQLLRAVINGEIALDARVFESLALKSRRSSTTFSVGQLVEVAKRTEPGMCEPGGVARITSVDVGRSGVECYDVGYVVGGRKEQRLLVSILQEHVEHAGRPRRSIEAATAGNGLQIFHFLM